MGIAENKSAIRRFLSQEVFFGEEENLAVVDEVFHPEVVFVGPEGEAQVDGAEAIAQLKYELRGYQRTRGEIDIPQQIAEGESVATRYTLEVEEEGTYEGVTFSHFADGKIKEYLILVGEYVDWRVRARAHN
jgi:hypothetical protein